MLTTNKEIIYDLYSSILSKPKLTQLIKSRLQDILISFEKMAPHHLFHHKN